MGGNGEVAGEDEGMPVGGIVTSVKGDKGNG